MVEFMLPKHSDIDALWRLLFWSGVLSASMRAVGKAFGPVVERYWPSAYEPIAAVGGALLSLLSDVIDAVGKLRRSAPSKPPVPPLPLLLVMALALAGCPGLPPVDNCTPNAWRCSPTGAPELCSPSTRWTPANRPCGEVNAVCCDQVMSHYGHLVAACMPLGACLQTHLDHEVSQ